MSEQLDGFSRFGPSTAHELRQRLAIPAPTDPNREQIDHPSHYGGDTIYEAIKVIEAWDLGFCLGNTVKYIARAGRKDANATIQDLEKAAWYLNRKIECLRTKGPVEGRG